MAILRVKYSFDIWHFFLLYLARKVWVFKMKLCIVFVYLKLQSVERNAVLSLCYVTSVLLLSVNISCLRTLVLGSKTIWVTQVSLHCLLFMWMTSDSVDFHRKIWFRLQAPFFSSRLQQFPFRRLGGVAVENMLVTSCFIKCSWCSIIREALKATTNM